MKRLLSILIIISLSFTGISQNWLQVGDAIEGEFADDYFGIAVSLNATGTIVAAGSDFNTGANGWAGHVRVFELIDETWVQLGEDIDGEAEGDLSGASVSLNAEGDIVAIGAPENDGTDENAGHVRVFQYINGSWIQLGTDIDGEGIYDLSGSEVELNSSGSRVAIGAYRNEVENGRAGHVRVYEFVDSTWVQLGNDLDGENNLDSYGTSVSFNYSGDILAVGAYENDNNGSYSGSVKIYSLVGSQWEVLGTEILGDTSSRAGVSVSLDSVGGRIALGAFQDKKNGWKSGSVKVYEYNASQWVQVGETLLGAEEETFGRAVKLSYDGSVLAVGAGGLNNRGYIRLFSLYEGRWLQLGHDIHGEEDEDYAGRSGSIGLSSNGNVIAVGADENDGNGSESGHVRIFKLDSFIIVDTLVEDTVLTYNSEAYNMGLVEVWRGDREIHVSLPEVSDIRASLYDIRGQEVNSLYLTSVNSFSMPALTRLKGIYFLYLENEKGQVHRLKVYID
jgi:hypothetical protein